MSSWPDAPERFTEPWRCPACFAPLTGTSCPSCGLDTATEGAGEVWALSQQVVERVAARDAAIAAVRRRQAETSAVPVSAPSPAQMPVAAATALPPAPPAAEPVGASPERVPGRSGVQVVLLVVGVVAVSVAVVFFLLLAYLLASLTIRSVITAVLSAVVLGAAVLLRRRGLPATAEGITVVGLVLLLLDLWIVRANDLFGSAGVDGRLFVGVGVGVVSGIGLGLLRASGLRAGALAGAAGLPIAAALVVLGLAADGRPTTWWAAGLAGALVGSQTGLRWTGVRSRVARVVGACWLLVAAALAGFALPGVPAGGALAFGAVAVVCALAAAAAARPTPSRHGGDLLVAAVAGGAAVALAVWAGAARGPAPLLPHPAETGVVLVPAAVAAVVRLRRPVAALRRDPLVAAGAGALGIALVPLLVLLGYAVEALAALPLAAVDGSFAGAVPRLGLPALGPLAGGLLGVVAVLWAVAGLSRRRQAIPVAAAASAGVLLVLAAATGSPWVAAGAGAVVGAAAIAVRARRTPGRLDAAAFVLLLLAAVQVSAAAQLDPVLWPPATAVSVLLLVGARAAGLRRPPSVPGAVLSGLVAGRLLLVAATLPSWQEAVGVRATTVADAVLVTAAALLLALAIPSPRTALRLDVRAAEAVAAGGVLLAGWGLLVQSTLQPGVLAAASALLAAAAAVQLRRGDREVEAVVAAVVGPVATALVLPLVLAAALPAGGDDGGLAIAAGVLVAALVRALLLRGTDPRLATLHDAVLLAVPLPLLPFAGWAATLVLAAAAAVVAWQGGEPFRATGWRRHVGWATAALVVLAVWRGLGDRGVNDQEAYGLPAAAVLLALAVLLAWRAPASPAALRSALAGIGLGFALLPSAIVGAAASAGTPRAVVAVVVAGLLVLAAPVVPAAVRGIAVRPVLLVVAGPVLVLVSAVRAAVAAGPLGVAEAWWLPAAGALAAAAVALAVRLGLRSLAAAVPGALAVVLATAVGLATSTRPDELPIRLLVALALDAALFAAVTAAGIDRTGTGRILQVAGIAGAAVAAMVGLTLAAPLSDRPAAIDPLELVSLPLAFALLVAGVARLRRETDRRSWPELGPGLCLLLLPSLLLDAAPAVLWRVVALGIVALAVLVVGALRGLSAPFLLGGAVFAVHALVQLWPAIAAVYDAVPWWLWVGIGGVLLIVLAARYERGVRELRHVARRLAAQR